MGPLEGFLATWSQARLTFGQGVPVGGTQFDRSAALRQLQAEVDSATPGDHWQGGAARAYNVANTEHGQVLGKLADLDARLAAEIEKSACVVAAGRAELDNVRDWVVDAASSTSDDHGGQIMRIVSTGLGQLRTILSNSNAELDDIGVQIRLLGVEYGGLSAQRFTP